MRQYLAVSMLVVPMLFVACNKKAKLSGQESTRSKMEAGGVIDPGTEDGKGATPTPTEEPTATPTEEPTASPTAGDDGKGDASDDGEGIGSTEGSGEGSDVSQSDGSDGKGDSDGSGPTPTPQPTACPDEPVAARSIGYISGDNASYMFTLARQQGKHNHPNAQRFVVDNETLLKFCSVMFSVEAAGQCLGTVSYDKLPYGTAFRSPNDDQATKWNGSEFVVSSAAVYQPRGSSTTDHGVFWGYAPMTCQCSATTKKVTTCN